MCPSEQINAVVSLLLFTSELDPMATVELPSSPVIAAVDLKPNSRQVLMNARALAAERQVPLLILHVAHETGESAGFYRRHIRNNDTTPIRDIAEEMLQELVEDVFGASGNQDAVEQPRTLVVEGIPGSRIVEVADREAANSIVLNCCGLHGVARWWHGSVSDYVQNHAHTEVVVLKEGTESTHVGMNEQHTPPTHASH